MKALLAWVIAGPVIAILVYLWVSQDAGPVRAWDSVPDHDPVVETYTSDFWAWDWVNYPCEPEPVGRWILTKWARGKATFAVWGKQPTGMCIQRTIEWRWR